MYKGLKNSFQITRLAADLRLHHKEDPVTSILTFCHRLHQPRHQGIPLHDTLRTDEGCGRKSRHALH